LPVCHHLLQAIVLAARLFRFDTGYVPVMLLAMRNWRNKKDHDYADLYGLIILIDNYNIPEEGLCFF